MKALIFKFCFVSLFISMPFLSHSSNDVNITVSGSGVDKETAVKVALRSALEQTYGTFVATNTKIFNDKLESDEIISLSRGNIKSYNILSEKQVAGGHWYVLLSAVVNIQQLVSYVHGQGSSVEVDMNAFSAKVQMEELNRNAERKIIETLIAEIESVDLWDYSIELDEPSVSGNNYVISGVVNVEYNANTNAIIKLMSDVFKNLDMANHQDNNVNGQKYYEYYLNGVLKNLWIGAEFPYERESVILRNEYNNGLFNYSKPIHGKGFLEPNITRNQFDGIRSNSLFLRKICFIIDPIGIEITGNKFFVCKTDETKQSSISRENSLTYCLMETRHIYVSKPKTNWNDFIFNRTGETIFRLYFRKEISREEALKIKKITVRPL